MRGNISSKLTVSTMKKPKHHPHAEKARNSKFIQVLQLCILYTAKHFLPIYPPTSLVLLLVFAVPQPYLIFPPNHHKSPPPPLDS